MNTEQHRIALLRAKKALKEEAKAERAERKIRLARIALRKERKVRAERKAVKVKERIKRERKVRKVTIEGRKLLREAEKAKRTLQTKKYGRGWYVFYEIEMCDDCSPPCDPDAPGTRWELRTQKISGQAFKYTMDEEDLQITQNEITSRIEPFWRTRSWRIVYIKGT